MSSLKIALLSVTAAMLVLCLGLFSTASADHRATGKAPAEAKMTAQAQQSVQQSVQADASCGGDPASLLTLQPDQGAHGSSWLGGPETSACPTNTVYTCCRCGGCGCRPRNISPTNWCAC